MTQSDYVDSLLISPALVRKGENIEVVRNRILNIIPRAINRIISRHDFHFACGETTVSGGTVVDQSDYECPGADDDARDLINVRYGDDLDLLEKWSATDMDDLLTWLGTQTSIKAWVRIPNMTDRNVPKIRLVATPDTAAETIKYRYRIKDISFVEYPDEWLHVLDEAIFISLQMPNNFDREMLKMIDHYSKEGGGAQPVRLGPERKNRMIELNDKHGYGG